MRRSTSSRKYAGHARCGRSEQFGPLPVGPLRPARACRRAFRTEGMENPRLSFLTPSLLAGDRSLVSVVAHELAHSWSGNLVTNATWRDGWLNEGMTSYLESRLMEIIYDVETGPTKRSVLGYEELLRNFETVPARTAEPSTAPRVGRCRRRAGHDSLPQGPALPAAPRKSSFGREVEWTSSCSAYFDEFAFKTITS